MKKIIAILILILLSCNGCGESKKTSVQDSDIINNSLISTQIPDESIEKNTSGIENIDMIYGKWKITDMVGYGYIYGDVSIEDYVGGDVTICEDYIKYELPSDKGKLEKPKFKLTKQNKDDFWEYSHANVENGFGFKDDQVDLIEVYDGNDKWDEFGGIFWVRDKEHLIFFGPVYFLAEKVE